MVLDINTLEHSVRKHLPLINHCLWYEWLDHTVESLARFFHSRQDVKLTLDSLVNMGILEQSLCNSYIVSQDPLIQAVIEHVNDNDRIIRKLCNSGFAF